MPFLQQKFQHFSYILRKIIKNIRLLKTKKGERNSVHIVFLLVTGVCYSFS